MRAPRSVFFMSMIGETHFLGFPRRREWPGVDRENTDGERNENAFEELDDEESRMKEQMAVVPGLGFES